MSFRSFVKTRSGAGPALLPRPPSRSLLARVIAGFATGCPPLATAGSSPLPDLSYGGASDGIARVDFGFAGRSDDSARAGLVLAGDRLLVAGIVAIGEAQGDIGFARLGFVDTPTVHRIARDRDATLFVGGTFDFSSMLIGRLDRDGAIDTSFNGAGFRHLGGGFLLNGGVAALATSVSRLSNGKILVSGVAGSVAMTCFALARLNADGSTDTSFGGGQGRTCVAPSLPGGRPFAYSSSHAIAADGRILLAGWAVRAGGSGYDMAVARFSADGVFDTSFGPAHGGWAFASFDHGGIDEYARAIAVDGTGRIVVAGDFTGVRSKDLAVVRWLPDGRFDTTFGDGGKAWFDLDWQDERGPSSDEAHSLFVLADQRILLGARSAGIGTAWMLKPNGALDPAFGRGGVLMQARRNASRTSQLAAEDMVLSGDHLYMTGTIESSGPSVPTNEDFGAVRYVMPLFRDGFDSAD